MTSVTLGIAAGIVFAWLWLWVVPWAVHGVFFKRMSFLTKGILSVDEPGDFLKLYKQLLLDTARYVGRNIAGTVVAGLPLLMLALVDPGLFSLEFMVAFLASMMIVFCWPRLWPARTAF